MPDMEFAHVDESKAPKCPFFPNLSKKSGNEIRWKEFLACGTVLLSSPKTGGSRHDLSVVLLLIEERLPCDIVILICGFAGPCDGDCHDLMDPKNSGETFVDMCNFHHLVISRTLFKQKACHKVNLV